MEKPSDLPPLTIPDPASHPQNPSTIASVAADEGLPHSLSRMGKALTPRTVYANRKADREATSLQMMMHMNAKKVKSIQGQFEAAGEAHRR